MKKVKTLSRFCGGISDFDRESLVQDGYAFGQSVDVRKNPQNLSLLPKTIKESGSVIQGLVKWGEIVRNGKTYMYDEKGNIYERTSAGSYSLIHTASMSHGNGLGYFGEDDFLYYTGDKTVGRYGPFTSATPQFVDDFFGSQGGTPLNTNSLELKKASSQYAYRNDNASLSITGNLSVEAQIHPTTLPASSEEMVLVSKWDENSNKRSYKFSVIPTSGYFGDGSDGDITISVNSTDTPVDSACTGTIDTYTLSATNASFAAGDEILIHQSQGTGAGNKQRNKIQSYTAGTITTVYPLNATYGTGAQVLVLKQYNNVTVNSGKTWTAKAWNGTVGGILAFLCNGNFINNGTITATGKGYRGGAGYTRPAYTSPWGNSSVWGYGGEGTLGLGTQTSSANGNGGAGGYFVNGPGNSDREGGGGGNGLAGDGAYYGYVAGGSTSGAADLSTMTFGGGGGGAATATDSAGPAYAGGAGGGILGLYANSFVNNGTIVANGNSSPYPSGTTGAAGGGGAGGSVDIKFITGTLGTVTASGGVKPALNKNGQTYDTAVSGAVGRVAVAYYTSYSGTSTPTANYIQDNTLFVDTGYALQLKISSNGTAVETFSKPCDLITDKWQQVAATYDISLKQAQFYLNAISLGTVAGSYTSINDNASKFAVGCDFDSAGTARNFYNGLIDEVRLYSTLKTVDDFMYGLNSQISVTTVGLNAYYKFNGDLNDATAAANHLTGVNTPTYSTDVPYPSPTTRLDIDQSLSTSGNTYTLPTTISEAASERQTFTPAKDPQKSISVYISAKGTGDWTLTVHDRYNNVIASRTVTNALLYTGTFEFIFSEVWRPITNFTNEYHFHLTSTVADGTVKTTSNNDLETAEFATYFQFLVEDTGFHPIGKMLQFMVIGNERYVATYEATQYEPNAIVLPSGWSVRCFGYYNEYLAIGAVRGPSITSQDAGRVYFWDGIASTYNFFIDVPEGGINTLVGSRGQLFIWAGYQGDMLVYQGGNSAEKIKRLPKMTEDSYVEIFPQAACMWKGLLRFGVAGNSNSTLVQRGAYTYGRVNIRYPDVLTYDYVASTGNTGNTVKIGMLMAVDQKLLMSWSDGTGYGVDYVDSNNDPFTYGYLDCLIDDSGVIWKEKEMNTIVTKHSSLATGQEVSISYREDDTLPWTAANIEANESSTISRALIADGKFYEHQIRIELRTTSTSQTLKGIGIEIDDQSSSSRV